MRGVVWKCMWSQKGRRRNPRQAERRRTGERHRPYPQAIRHRQTLPVKGWQNTGTGGFSWVRVLEMGMRVLRRPAGGSRLQAAGIDKADPVFQLFPQAALPWCFGTACGSSSAVSFPFPYARQEFFIMAVFTIKGWFDEDRLQPGVLCDLPEVREGPVKKQYYGFRDHLRKV